MQVKAGDIFECEGSFYQAIKATAKTATIRPIESTFEGLADAYGWEHSYQSTHRAGSKANEEDARTTWRRLHGNAGWCEVVPGSVRLESED